MAKYRDKLPQLSNQLFLADGGLETTLIFHQGVDLPYFASFHLMRTEDGRRRLRDYYIRFIEIAREGGLGFMLETPTWRANRDWGARLGYDAPALDAVNRQAVEMLAGLRDDYETASSPMPICGVIGPRGDGYVAGATMSAEEAETYHAAQVASFAQSAADMAGAFTLTYPQEAIGVTRAARGAGLPVAISFTLETDGRLPTGMSLREAIETVDGETGAAPAYYTINCAHPTHFADALEAEGDWIKRLRSLRANASRRSHAELDEAEDLDSGDPVELGQQYREMIRRRPWINVLGGCCGTDYRHVEQIRLACAPVAGAAA